MCGVCETEICCKNPQQVYLVHKEILTVKKSMLSSDFIMVIIWSRLLCNSNLVHSKLHFHKNAFHILQKCPQTLLKVFQCIPTTCKPQAGIPVYSSPVLQQLHCHDTYHHVQKLDWKPPYSSIWWDALSFDNRRSCQQWITVQSWRWRIWRVARGSHVGGHVAWPELLSKTWYSYGLWWLIGLKHYRQVGSLRTAVMKLTSYQSIH